MSNTTGNSGLIIRTEVYSEELKRRLMDQLYAQRFVDWIDFPDGTTLTIPSIGGASTQTITEGVPVTYSAIDKGEWQLTITNYEGSATSITNKLRQDSKWGADLEASFVAEQHRALMERLETETYKAFGPNAASGGGQTAAATNAINGASHRWVASGANETISPIDFAKATYALTKAKVPLNGLIAIVDPSVAYALETATNLVSVSNNPMWEGVIASGALSGDGMRFTKNVYGFDVYVSQYLDDCNETIGGLTTAAGKQNVFFAAGGNGDLAPLKGAWRQMPKVDGEYNKDLQQEEYVTTARWGIKTYRPENVVCVLSDTDQV